MGKEMENVELRPGERMDDLQRNGFRVIQSPDAFRFGTDSVLLADFARPRRGDNCVDMGCGTGAIALIMLAHRSDIRVTGIELQPEIADMARRSAALNGVEDRFKVIAGDMRAVSMELPRASYSLAVCNPPYFKDGGTMVSSSETIRLARHETDITPVEISLTAARLLKFGGKFAVVYPAPRALEMMRAMEDAGIAPKHVRTVHGVEGRAPKHILIDGIRGGSPGLNWMKPLVLRDAQGKETAEWHRIYD